MSAKAKGAKVQNNEEQLKRLYNVAFDSVDLDDSEFLEKS